MSILRSNYPAEYELGLHLEQQYGYEIPSLLFSTCNPKIIENMKELHNEHPLVQGVTAALKPYYPKFKKFTAMGNNELTWGFGNQIEPFSINNANPNWSHWIITLPEHKARGSATQDWCNMVSANLALLIDCANAEKSGADRRNQLFEITSLGLYGKGNRHHNSYSVNGAISPILADWLEQMHDSDKSVVQQAICNAYKYMFGKRESRGVKPSDFQIFTQEGKFNINLNEICGVWLEGDRNDWELPGYLISTHNCQGAPYQLLLLVALGKIHDIARLQGI